MFLPLLLLKNRGTVWTRRKLLFVLSLIESLFPFMAWQRRPGREGGEQSHADHVEGLYYQEAGYCFLFPLQGMSERGH